MRKQHAVQKRWRPAFIQYVTIALSGRYMLDRPIGLSNDFLSHTLHDAIRSIQPDDYAWFARDSALCIESYRQTTLQQGKEWIDGEDGVSSIRGLHDLMTKSKSAAVDRRRAHVRSVLQAQAKLQAKRNSSALDEDSSAITPETLRKVSMASSKDCVQYAIQLAARDGDVPSSFLLTRLFANSHQHHHKK